MTDYNGNVVLKYTVVMATSWHRRFTESCGGCCRRHASADLAINQVASEAGELVTGQLTADDIEIGTGEELGTSLIYSLSGDPIAGLLINADGSFSFDPKDAAYEYLAVGEEQLITVNYRVTDPGLNGAAGLFAEKTFTITVKGTNEDPVVDLNGIATLATTEDTAYEVSVNQLLQGFRMWTPPMCWLFRA